jgi:hypothetical protein
VTSSWKLSESHYRIWRMFYGFLRRGIWMNEWVEKVYDGLDRE